MVANYCVNVQTSLLIHSTTILQIDNRIPMYDRNFCLNVEARERHVEIRAALTAFPSGSTVSAFVASAVVVWIQLHVKLQWG